MRYRLLGSSGLRVSELCLGTMTFGTDWGWGADQDESRRIFERFVGAGGNFVDTANNYTNGTSEKYVGEFIAAEREHLVVATKYSLTESRSDPNAGGNSRKNMVQTVERSLARLNTSYVDVLYLHMWDFLTPVSEVLRAADDLIRSGKVLYFAFSDTPAWVVSHAVALAETRGWSRPLAIQVPYSLFRRDPERDIFPMARQLDLTVTAWAVLGQGTLTGKYNPERMVATEPKRFDSAGKDALASADMLATMGREIGQTPAQIAINYVRAQQGNVVPIVGARTARQMEENLKALDFGLTREQIARIHAANDFALGFPLEFLTRDHIRGLIFGDTFGKIDSHRTPVLFTV